MSGLAGFCDFNQKSSRQHLSAMTQALSHRGPDDSGYEFIELANLNLGLGHKRLAILDLTDHGHQPMKTEDGNYVLIYDGRLSNANDMRQELMNRGIKFRSNTDAEVVLKSFAKWGVGAIDKYIGMFAFVIYNRNEEKLYLFRDRYGVKPLYYYWKNGILLFASELKAFQKNPYFVKELDPIGFNNYAQFGYIPAPHSIYKHAFKVNPGHFIEMNIKNPDIKITKYWDIRDFWDKPKLKISEQEAKHELEKLFVSSVRSQMSSDKPIGCFLSGGYDSSFIAAILQQNSSSQIKTFCLGFDHELNEAPHSKIVANYLGTEHIECFCSDADVLDIVSTLPETYDEPFSFLTIIPALYLNKIVKKHVDVVFGGIPEVTRFTDPNYYFGRYDILYKIFRMPQVFRRLSSPMLKTFVYLLYKGKIRKFKRFFDKLDATVNANCLSEIVENQANGFLKYYNWFPNMWGSAFNASEITFDNFQPTGSKLDDLDKLAYFLKNRYEAHLSLLREERAATLMSLELREPFTDHRLQEFDAVMPAKFKIKGELEKYLFKEIVHQYIPQDIMNKPKVGFGFLLPKLSWLSNELNGLLQHYLARSSLEETGIFNVDYITNIKGRFASVDRNNRLLAKQLWQAVAFQMWYKQCF